MLRAGVARAGIASLAAQPPAGFVPLSMPGRVVRVKKSGCLEANGLFPKPDDAKAMLQPRDAGAHGQGRPRRGREALRAPAGQGVREGQRHRAAEHDDEQGARPPVRRGDGRRGRARPRTSRCSSSTRASSRRRASARRTCPRASAISWHSNNDATMDWRDIPGGGPRQVRARPHRVDGPHQLRPREGPLDPGLHRRAEEHDARLQHQPAGLPPAPRQPADRHPRRAGRPALAPAPLHHRRLQADGPRRARSGSSRSTSCRTRRSTSSTDPVAVDAHRLGRGREGAGRIRPEVAEGRGSRARLHPPPRPTLA